MRRKLNHPYGYKVGYREIGSRLYIRQFITRTHQQAHRTLLFYRKYGHTGCRKKDIEKFNYSLKPITHKEFLAGIWDEIPFQLKIPPIRTVSSIHDLLSIATIHHIALFLGLNLSQHLQPLRL